MHCKKKKNSFYSILCIFLQFSSFFQIGQYIGEMCRYILAVPPSPVDTKHRLRLILGNGVRPNVWKLFLDRYKLPKIIEFYGATEGNSNISK